MKTLETSFKKQGYQYTQVKREGLVAIYEQKNEETGKVIAYEVFEIEVAPEGYAGPGRYFQPEREIVPSTNKWGTKGFTCRDMEAAEVRFKFLQERMTTSSKKQKHAKV